MGKVGVMIIEDCAPVRELLEHIVRSDDRLRVVASVKSAEEGLQVLNRAAPDVISMDIHLPGMDGVEATRRVMSERPTPVVVVSAGVGCDDFGVSMEAVRAGALAVVEKPVGLGHEAYAEIADSLADQLFSMSQVAVIRLRRRTESSSKPTAKPPEREARPRRSYRAVGIVASTGGPSALEEVLRGIGPGFPLPVFVVQHMAASFLPGFSQWLSRVSGISVQIGSAHAKPMPGEVYLAPGDRHLVLERGEIQLESGAAVRAQIPSGDVLLDSLARELGAETIGVVLTGMGDDGARGLQSIRAAGGHTIAESATSAVVYGMPGAAVARGAVRDSLPREAIAPRLLSLSTTEVLSGGGGR